MKMANAEGADERERKRERKKEQIEVRREAKAKRTNCIHEALSILLIQLD